MKKIPLPAIEAILGFSAADACERMRQLTLMKRAVVDLMAAGLKAKEIGARLGNSPRTIGVHQNYARKKLGARHYVDVVRIVYAAKLAKGS